MTSAELLNEIDTKLHELSHMSEFAADLASEMEVDGDHFRILADRGDRLVFCCYQVVRRVKQLRDTVAPVTREPDPAFALIAAKRAANVAQDEAIDAQDEAQTRFGRRSEAAWVADEASEAACHAANEIDWQLARVRPTTLAGVAAVLRLANQIEDEGNEWPDTDTIGREGWHYQLRATMAAAIEAIMQRDTPAA